MAFKFRRGGKKKGGSIRLTGLFKTKRRGLWVGSVTEMDEMISKIKAAKADDKGLVFFLWRNEDEEGPAYTISMDVSQDDDRPKKSFGKPKRRPEPDEEDDDQDEDADSKDEDEEPPF